MADNSEMIAALQAQLALELAKQTANSTHLSNSMLAPMQKPVEGTLSDALGMALNGEEAIRQAERMTKVNEELDLSQSQPDIVVLDNNFSAFDPLATFGSHTIPAFFDYVVDSPTTKATFSDMPESLKPLDWISVNTANGVYFTLNTSGDGGKVIMSNAHLTPVNVGIIPTMATSKYLPDTMSVAERKLVPVSGTARGRLHWDISAWADIIARGMVFLVTDDAPAKRVCLERNSVFTTLYNGKDFYFSTYMDLKVMQQYTSDAIYDQLAELNPQLETNFVGQEAIAQYMHEKVNTYLVRGLMDPLGARMVERFRNSMNILERGAFSRSLQAIQNASSLFMRVYDEPLNLTSRNLVAPDNESVRAMAVLSVMTSSSQEPFVADVIKRIIQTSMFDLKSVASAQKTVFMNANAPNPTIPGIADITVEKVVEFFIARNRQHMFDIQIKYPQYSPDNIAALAQLVFGHMMFAMRYPDIIMMNLGTWMKEFFVLLRVLAPSEMAYYLAQQGFTVNANGVRDSDIIVGVSMDAIRNGNIDFTFLRPVAGDNTHANTIYKLRWVFSTCLAWWQPTVRTRTTNSGGLSLDPSTSTFVGTPVYHGTSPSETAFNTAAIAIQQAILEIVKKSTSHSQNSIKGPPLKSIQDAAALMNDFYFEALGVAVCAALSQQLVDPKFVPPVPVNVYSDKQARDQFFATCTPIILTHPDRRNGTSARIVKERKVVYVPIMFEYALVLRAENKIPPAAKEDAIVLLPELGEMSWNWLQTLLWNSFFGLRALVMASAISQNIQPPQAPNGPIGIELPYMEEIAARANTEHAMKSSEYRACFFAILETLGGNPKFFEFLSFTESSDFRAMMPNMWGCNGVNITTLTVIPGVTHMNANVPEQWTLTDPNLNEVMLDVDSVLISPTYGASNDVITTPAEPLIVGKMTLPLGEPTDAFGVAFPDMLQSLMVGNDQLVAPAAQLPAAFAANRAYVVTQDRWRVHPINNGLNAFYELQVLTGPAPGVWTSIAHTPKVTYAFPPGAGGRIRKMTIPQFILMIDPRSMNWVNLEPGKKNIIHTAFLSHNIMLAFDDVLYQPRFYGFNAKEVETTFGDLSTYESHLLAVTKNLLDTNGSVILEPIFVDQRESSAFATINRRASPEVTTYFHSFPGTANLPIPLLRVSHGSAIPPVYDPPRGVQDTILLQAFDPGTQNDVTVYSQRTQVPGDDKFDRDAFLPSFFNEATFHRLDCLTHIAPPPRFSDSLTEARGVNVWE